MSAGNTYELEAWKFHKTLLGMDEAGRGPLAGPLVVAGVILPEGFVCEELDDSKKLTEKARNRLYPKILKEAAWYAVEIVSPEEIDRYDIYHATQRTMEKIAQKAHADFTLTDAMPLNLNIPYKSLIKGDHLSVSISAASILAKVTRDEIMYAYDRLYPEYDFAGHKGYPTKKHLELMELHGLIPIYRNSYAPVRKLREFQLSLRIE
ncbi:MAG: ribonuclease HII [Erysipelotrichales bacterium]|nr:ribonuclease HII [Erysipelotrichales bacterium]